MPETSSGEKDELEVLLSFLKKTKEGTYAPIDETSLPYSRIVEETETVESFEEEFYYGVN